MTKIQRERGKLELKIADIEYCLSVGYGLRRFLEGCRLSLLPGSQLDQLEGEPDTVLPLEVYFKLKEDARFCELVINGDCFLYQPVRICPLDY